MARQSSLNIQDYLNDDVMDNLAETLDGVISTIFLVVSPVALAT